MEINSREGKNVNKTVKRNKRRKYESRLALCKIIVGNIVTYTCWDKTIHITGMGFPSFTYVPVLAYSYNKRSFVKNASYYHLGFSKVDFMMASQRKVVENSMFLELNDIMELKIHEETN